MMPLPRELCTSKQYSDDLRFDLLPIQAGLGGSPWRVAVASVLLCRTKRTSIESVLEELFDRWPTPSDLCRSGTELEVLLMSLGLYRIRARQLQRLSFKWLEGGWEYLRDLPGVGAYVADAVGLVCFNCTELETQDKALTKYAEVVRDAVIRDNSDVTGTSRDA